MTEVGSGLFGSRTKVRAELPDPLCYEKLFDEVLVGLNGQYLGSFTSLYVPAFNLRYPVGWTNGSWYETGAAVKEPRPECGCVDCEGSYDELYGGRYIRQTIPDEEITCANASTFDNFDYAIMPSRYLGSEGCEYVFQPTYPCGGVAFPPPGKCTINVALQFWLEEPWPWPLVPFSFMNPSSRIRVVEDLSGPPGCEEALALEIDFSGVGNEGVSFVGEDGGYDGTSPPQTGVSQADRSNTGWTVEDGSCWIEKFYIKAVPDNDGFVCEGYHIHTRAGLYPFPFARILAGGDPGPLILNGDWQEWYYVWTADYTMTPNPLLNSMWGIYTTATNPFNPEPPCQRPLHARKGRVHIKQPHLAQCTTSDGVIIKRPSGMGT